MTSNEVLALATEYSATEASVEESNILLVGTFYCIKEIDEKNGKRLDINQRERDSRRVLYVIPMADATQSPDHQDLT